jgi:signal transduction histidine kinase
MSREAILIRDLLKLASAGEAVIDREPVDLATLADDCWMNVETTQATLVTDIDRTIHADQSRLKQVFENLIRNAIEHCGQAVTVTVGELADGFYIEDTGPGIPEADRERVFESGYSTSDDGTGFGLNIVHRFTPRTTSVLSRRLPLTCQQVNAGDKDNCQGWSL